MCVTGGLNCEEIGRVELRRADRKLLESMKSQIKNTARLAVLFLFLDGCHGFATLSQLQTLISFSSTPILPDITTTSLSMGNDNNGLNEMTKGGFTVKQRLREEVESPFRKVRLYLLLYTVGSATIAFYFSGLSTIKAIVGGFEDAPPLQEALTNDAINIAGVVVAGYFAYREYQAGQTNLQRIAKGGQLAKLLVDPASGGRAALADYRRKSRVLIAAGGEDYMDTLTRSLTADQLKDENSICDKLAEAEVMVVPVLLKKDGSGKIVVDNTRDFWLAVQGKEGDRNFDITRAEPVVAFPCGNTDWTEYLASEIETASGQGFDVLEKGVTITVKKNGKLLRRATGQPPFGEFLGAMEVLDGSKFGMPGDSAKYGGP